MAQFIALLKRNYDGFSEADFAPLLEPEAERARQLYAQGVVRAIWGRKDVPGSVFLIEAESQDAARGLLDTLPLRAKGMLDLDAIVPIGPYRGFGPRSS
jgi:muconolactone delta-isomerase